jgi:hypothetical protein
MLKATFLRTARSVSFPDWSVGIFLFTIILKKKQVFRVHPYSYLVLVFKYLQKEISSQTIIPLYGEV